MSRVVRAAYIHHIIWGAVCLLLVGLLLIVWTNSQKLNRQTQTLQQQITALSAASCQSRDTWQPGTAQQFTITSGSLTRTYLVHLPTGFKDNQTYPAIFYFPGKGGSSTDGEQRSGISDLPVVSVYPQPTIGLDGVFAWQGAPYSSSADDVAFVGDILDRISGQLCIKRSQVYAAGMSNGAGFAALLACRLPDRIAAFGLVAGAYYAPMSQCVPKKPTPIINIHGDADPSVPYTGSIQRKLPDINNRALQWAKQNGCALDPFVSHVGLSMTVSTWQFCKNNATVQNIRIHGGGHSWGADIPQTIWRFMSAHSLQ